MHLVWILMCLLSLHVVKNQGQDFTHKPNDQQKADDGTSITMAWTLPNPVNTRLDTTIFYHESDVIATMKRNASSSNEYLPQYGPLYDSTKVTVLPVGSNTMMIGFTLHDLTVTGGDGNCDAGQYRCWHQIPTGPPYDDTTHLFVYGQPATHQISMSPTQTAEGDTVTLTCSAQSTSQPTGYRENITYSWIFGSGQLPNQRHDVQGQNHERLVITNLQKTDDDQPYQCTAREGSSNLTSAKTKQLNVLYKPGGAQPVGVPTTVIQGDSVDLVCSVSDRGNPTSQMKFKPPVGDIISDTNGDGRITVDPVNITLHDGSWECYGQNDVDKGSSATFDITVQVRPHVIDHPPENKNASIKDQFDASCRISALPEPTLKWKYNGTLGLPVGVNATTSTQSNNREVEITSVLQWTSGSTDAQRKAAGGQYQCQGNNIVDTVTSTTMHLNVQYGPEQVHLSQNGPITAVEGDDVTVTCQADCNPQCSYTWYLDNNKLVENPELRLENIQRHQQGSYKCVAQNTVLNISRYEEATIRINVNFGSKVKTFSYHPPAPSQGVTVTLHCTAEGRPVSDITLYNVTGGHNDTIRMVTGTTLDHRLQNADCLDSGRFKCEAKNYINTHAMEKYLDITCPARSAEVHPSGGIASAPVGNTTVFEFRVIANPEPTDNGRWVFAAQGQTSEEGLPGNAVNTSDGNMRYLSIDNIQQDNFGNYTYVVDSLNVMFYLTPIGPPVIPSGLHLVKATAVSLTIQWNAAFNSGASQTFHITYSQLSNGQKWQDETVADTSTPDNKAIVYKLKQELIPLEQYTVEIWAVNVHGASSRITEIFQTIDRPTVSTDSVTYQTDLEARVVHITGLQISGAPVTHMEFVVCEDGNADNCVTTVVNNTARRRRNTRSTGTITVELPDQGDKFQIMMYLYDGDDLVYDTDGVTFGQVSVVPVAIIAGVCAGVVVLALVAVVVVILWRKGKLPTKTKGSTSNSSRSSEDLLGDELQPYGVASANPPKKKTNGNVDLYAEVEHNNTGRTVPDVYAEVQKKDKNKNTPAPEPVVYAEVNKDKKKKKVPTATLR